MNTRNILWNIKLFCDRWNILTLSSYGDEFMVSEASLNDIVFALLRHLV